MQAVWYGQRGPLSATIPRFGKLLEPTSHDIHDSMMRLIRYALLAVFSALHGASAAEGDICYALGTNSVIIRDRLYFMGGNLSIAGPDGQEVKSDTSLRWFQLNEDLPVQKIIPASAYDTETIDTSASVAYANAGHGLQNINQSFTGTLWAADDAFYVYGGSDDQSLTSTLSTYNASSQIWRDVQIVGGSYNYGNRSGASSISDASSGVGWISGGIDPVQESPNLLQFNASQPSRLKWDLIENVANAPNLKGGNTVYIPAGEQGMLVSFGGFNLSAINGTIVDMPADWSLIHVYDIASRVWWKQKTSDLLRAGDTPSDVGEACVGVGISADGSSYHITKYGGRKGDRTRVFETIYTLSIPSFTWVNMTSLSAGSNVQAKVHPLIGTSSPSCQTYNYSQMIVFGGIVRSGKDPIDYTNCQDDFAPLRVLDLSTYEWQTKFDPSISFKVPQIIYGALGGDENGGATKTAPVAGFTDPALSAALQKQVARTGTVTSLPSSTTTTTASIYHDFVTSSSNTGAIAGGVVGGLVGLAVIGALIWVCLRRRRKASAARKDVVTVAAGQKLLGLHSPAELGPNGIHETQAKPRVWKADTGGTDAVHELDNSGQGVELEGSRGWSR